MFMFGNYCVLFLFPWLSKKLKQLPNLELAIGYFPDFMVRYRLKKSMGCIKQILAALLVPGMVENFSTGLGESVGQGWNSPQTIILHHSPHEQSIFVYCLPIIWVQIDSSTVLDSGSLKNTNYKLSCHNLNYNRL